MLPPAQMAGSLKETMEVFAVPHLRLELSCEVQALYQMEQRTELIFEPSVLAEEPRWEEESVAKVTRLSVQAEDAES